MVSVLTRQVEGLDADAERSAREMFPRTTSVLDALAAGLFTADRVNAQLDGALTLWGAEGVLDPPPEA